VNDKYLGVNADAEKAMQEIVRTNDLINGGFITPKDLENLLYTLTDDQIFAVTGPIPDPAKISVLNYSVVVEVIQHIMSLTLPKGEEPELRLPDWDEKILFNGLSSVTARYLNNGFIQVHSLETFLSRNGEFLADALRDRLNDIYIEESASYSGDDLFWNIVNRASPVAAQHYQSAVIVILSKYFESCDIFKEPDKDNA